MPFQENNFVRNQNFARDRDLGPPEDTISADRIDDEFDNMGEGLSVLRTALASALQAIDELEEAAEGEGPYTKAESDERFPAKAAALAKAGDTTAGALTLGGKAGARKGVVTGGTVTFDYADGNVQDVFINGAVTFAFTNLPDIGGTLQINVTFTAGSITVSGSTWWELGNGEKSTVFGDLDLTIATGRPYRMLIEMVSGYRTGIFQ